MVASAIASAIGAIAVAGASAYSSYSQSRTAQNVLGATHAFHDAGGLDLLKKMSNWSKNGKMDWNTLLKDLQGLSDNIGEYANSAYNYYLEDMAFQKQVNYNFDAMEKQYQYGLKTMAEQYKYDVDMQNKSYEQSVNLINQQNAWSKMMSDTSHQREVADLRSAGLNPILSTNAGANAYSSGGAIIGSNTPQPSMPSALGVQKPNYASATELALNKQRLMNETKKNDAEINYINQQTQNLRNNPQGILGEIRDLLGDWIEGKDYELNTNAEIKGNNAFSNLLGHMKNFDLKGVGKAVFRGLLNNFNPATRGLDYLFKEGGINALKSVLNTNRGRSNYSTIHTKHGDLYDIDDYIRKTYNVK